MLVGTMKLFLVNYVYFSNIRCLLVTDSYLKNTEMFWSPNTRSSRPEVFCEKDVFKKFAKFTGKYLCQNLFFVTLQASVLKKETLAQVFSCEFCEIFKNIYFYRTPLVTASVFRNKTWTIILPIFLTFSCDLLFTVLGQLPPRKIAPNPKTNPKPNPNLTRGNFLRGQLPGCAQP